VVMTTVPTRGCRCLGKHHPQHKENGNFTITIKRI
jgi:hypothetical protein